MKYAPREAACWIRNRYNEAPAARPSYTFWDKSGEKLIYNINVAWYTFRSCEVALLYSTLIWTEIVCAAKSTR